MRELIIGGESDIAQGHNIHIVLTVFSRRYSGFMEMVEAEMKETGIIMSGNHPKLIIDGIKTMTRRTWGLEEINQMPHMWEYLYPKSNSPFHFFKNIPTDDVIETKCPYGQVGDRLIIKETWATENCYNHLKSSDIPKTAKIYYLADGNYSPFEMGKVRSAMFMCNWMSRARSEITELRAERLQEITEEDAKAEGANGYLVTKFRYGELYRAFREYHEEAFPIIDHADIGDILRFQGRNLGFACFQSRNPRCIAGTLNIDQRQAFNYIGSIEPNYRLGFQILWGSLNAKRGYGWETNPWVWVISFEVAK